MDSGLRQRPRLLTVALLSGLSAASALSVRGDVAARRGEGGAHRSSRGEVPLGAGWVRKCGELNGFGVSARLCGARTATARVRDEAGCLELRGGGMAFSDGSFLQLFVSLPMAVLLYGAVAGVVWLLTWVADAVASTSGFPRLARRRAVKYILGDPGHQAAHAPAVPQTRASDAPGTNRAMLALGAVSTVGCAVAVAGNAALSESAGRARQVPRQEREDRGEEIAAPPLQQTVVGRARRAGIEHGIYGPAVGEMYGYELRSRMLSSGKDQ